VRRSTERSFSRRRLGGIAGRLSSPSPRASERLRVLVLPEWYPSPEEPVSGVFVRDQARAAARAHDVTILFHDPRKCRNRWPFVSDRVEDGLRTVRVHTRTGPATTVGRIAFVFAAVRLLRTLRRRGEAPDIVHAHVYSAGLIALLLSRGSCPVVVSEHHSDFVEGKVRGNEARMARFVFRHASLVCPVSPSLLTHLEELEPSGRYEVVPNVVDVEAFVSRSERPAQGAGTKRLLVVALLSPQKGIAYLLDGLAEVYRTRQDFTLDVVGDGPLRLQLEQLARDRLPRSVVNFHGLLERDRVAELMTRADVLVVPSVVETFGVVVIEALAAGLPVIATRAVANHEYLQDRFGLVVAPCRAGSLRDAVLTMLDAGWTVPRGAALEVARSFSESVVSQRWSEIYRMLCR
jgi:glycosyltransferase involved in cell wall biosynthesis